MLPTPIAGRPREVSHIVAAVRVVRDSRDVCNYSAISTLLSQWPPCFCRFTAEALHRQLTPKASSDVDELDFGDVVITTTITISFGSAGWSVDALIKIWT